MRKLGSIKTYPISIVNDFDDKRLATIDFWQEGAIVAVEKIVSMDKLSKCDFLRVLLLTERAYTSSVLKREIERA